MNFADFQKAADRAIEDNDNWKDGKLNVDFFEADIWIDMKPDFKEAVTLMEWIDQALDQLQGSVEFTNCN